MYRYDACMCIYLICAGHYIGWVRQEPGSNVWWKYDDDKVTQVGTAEILELKGGGDWHTAYLTFYRFKE
jgi:ubiquitin carboxyl-terminal hydrolase 14